MTTRDEVYNYLVTILDSNSFEKNDKNRKIAIKHKLTKEEMDGLVCHITNLLGQNIIQDPEEKGFNNYKFNSRYINIDNDSIKLDKYGRIYVDINAFLNEDSIVEKILSNAEFTNKIKSYFEPEEIQMKFIVRKLLNNTFFLTSLVDLVTAIQKIEGDKKLTLQQLLEHINSETMIYTPEQINETINEQNNQTNEENQENNGEQGTSDTQEPNENDINNNENLGNNSDNSDNVQNNESNGQTEEQNEGQSEEQIKYACQFCNKEVSEIDGVCPHCGADLTFWKPNRI